MFNRQFLYFLFYKQGYRKLGIKSDKSFSILKEKVQNFVISKYSNRVPFLVAALIYAYKFFNLFNIYVIFIQHFI